jgi:hypothetical protein
MPIRVFSQQRATLAAVLRNTEPSLQAEVSATFGATPPELQQAQYDYSTEHGAHQAVLHAAGKRVKLDKENCDWNENPEGNEQSDHSVVMPFEAFQLIFVHCGISFQDVSLKIALATTALQIETLPRAHWVYLSPLFYGEKHAQRYPVILRHSSARLVFQRVC